MDCVPHIHVEMLIPSVTLFGDRDSEEVMKTKGYQEGEALTC